LSRKPCDIPNEIWSVRATGKVHDVWAQQASADWRAFLQYRAVEMQPSARLIIVGSGADADGKSGAEALVDLANAVLQKLVKEGVIEASEYEQMAIPTYYRTAAEWKEPFTSGIVRTRGLSLDHFEELRLPDVLLEKFEQDGNAETFAEAYTGFFKAAYEPCLFASLSNNRTPEDRERVIDSFSARLQAAIAQDPRKYSCCWVLHLMVIARNESKASNSG
jgi:SAM dependent carboxyl methyltransferase